MIWEFWGEVKVEKWDWRVIRIQVIFTSMELKEVAKEKMQMEKRKSEGCVLGLHNTDMSGGASKGDWGGRACEAGENHHLVQSTAQHIKLTPHKSAEGKHEWSGFCLLISSPAIPSGPPCILTTPSNAGKCSVHRHSSRSLCICMFSSPCFECFFLLFPFKIDDACSSYWWVWCLFLGNLLCPCIRILNYLLQDSEQAEHKDGGGGLVANLGPILKTQWTVAHQAPLSMGFLRQE